MTCSDVHRAIREGRHQNPELAEHAASCPACAELLASSGLLARAMAELEPTPAGHAPPSPTVTWSRSLTDRGPMVWGLRLPTFAKHGVLLAALASILAGVLAWHPRPDLGAYPAARMALVLGALGLLGVVVTAVRLRPLHRPPLRWRGGFLAMGIVVPLLLAGLGEAHTGHAASMSKGPFWTAAFTCFVMGSAMSGVMFPLLMWFERRRRVPLVLVGLSAAAVGVTGDVALQLFCPLTDPLHLVVGHASLGLVWAAVAVGLTSALRAVRAS